MPSKTLCGLLRRRAVAVWNLDSTRVLYRGRVVKVMGTAALIQPTPRLKMPAAVVPLMQLQLLPIVDPRGRRGQPVRCLKWQCSGKWAGIGPGPTWVTRIPTPTHPDRHVAIFGRRYRLGEPGRRYYVEKFRAVFYPGDGTHDQLAEVRSLRSAKEHARFLLKGRGIL